MIFPRFSTTFLFSPAFGQRILENKIATKIIGLDLLSGRNSMQSYVEFDWIYSDRSCKLARKGWRLLLHSETAVTDPRVTHGHHDLFSFDLSFEGVPLIVDPGRRNYALPRDEQAAGILEEWHNTFMFKNVRTGFCPRGYMPSSWLESFRSRPRVVSEGMPLRFY